jgi:MOSC domain-containing protein YiiM
MAILLSVNVGSVRTNPWKDVGTTGIDKRPVEGPVAVSAPGPKGSGAVGIAGDRVHDIKNHGGDDQAVYAYAREDLDEWAELLGHELPGGVFGENLTTSGLDVSGALIGEHWRIGEAVVLEVARPRIPCGTFEGWMREKGWIKRFTQRALPGAYLRVIAAGEIQAGDQIAVEDRPGHDVTVALAFRALTLEPGLLPKLAVIEGLPEDTKQTIRRRVSLSSRRG